MVHYTGPSFVLTFFCLADAYAIPRVTIYLLLLLHIRAFYCISLGSQRAIRGKAIINAIAIASQ